MDISSISNADILREGMNIKLDEAKTNSFQEILERTASQNDTKQLKSACKAFESYFLYTMLKQMRSTVPNDGVIPRSQAELIFQDMLDEETTKSAADAGGVGLADMLYKQLSRQV